MIFASLPSFLEWSKAPKSLNKILFFLLWSSDQGEVEEVVNTLSNLLFTQSSSKEGIISLDGETLSIPQLESEWLTHSLFVSKKFLVLHCRQPISGALEKFIIQTIKAKYAQYPLLLLHTSKEKSPSNELSNLAREHGLYANFTEEKNWKKQSRLADWIVESLKTQNKHISPPLAQLILYRIGADTKALSQELDKIIAYIGDKVEVTRQDIDLLVPFHNAEDSIWNIKDALLGHKTKIALELIEDLLDRGDHPITLLQALKTQISNGYIIAEILQKRGSESEITKIFPYLKGKILEKMIAQVSNFGIANFSCAVKALLDADREIRESKAPAKIIFSQMISKIFPLN